MSEYRLCTHYHRDQRSHGEQDRQDPHFHDVTSVISEMPARY
jgi:hypothetical protein